MRKHALITGGTEGIGLELAKLFAKDNCNLLIVARNKEKLLQVKNYIENEYKVDVDILSVDLSIHNSCEEIFKFVDKKNITVDYLINNAGIGSFGFFHKGESRFEENLININIVSLTNLTKYFIEKMVEKNHGGVINIASTAAFVGGPKMAMYYSSKAYVLSLTEALYEEVKDLGIKVSCVCPGPVKTSFQSKAGIKKSEKAKKYLMDADKVAKIAYKEFFKGKAIIIPGYKNKLLVWGTKLIPRSISRKIILKNNA
ncbi:SDR family oxidoreductase [Clostridium sp. ZBS2]|uniref:SDR family NAD(P)-dependent oxidoreductase n=1 Tax=Clostridium sp. ZBS2 TaxID=2949976 RepID=UPI002079ACD4|nr:SDR family oxidoreductase [Clostridium sp. ZBS2]